MYFASRVQAGRMLAAQLAIKYQNEKCAVVALSDGGVMVGAQIAQKLHCVLTLLMNAEISLPREPNAIASITSDGSMAYNSIYSQGELDELVGEYHTYVEEEKLNRIRELNFLVGGSETINKSLLSNHAVILVADGLRTGSPLELAKEFLKPLQIKKLIVATPFASVAAVDKMHVLADDLCCLNVLGDYIDTDHYYDQQDVPDHETVVKVIEQVIEQWK